MGIPDKSQKRVEMSYSSEILKPYISMRIQTHGFEDDLVKSRIRGGPHDAPITGELVT